MRDGGVVVDAEARRGAGHRVVQAARDVHRVERATLPDGQRRVDRPLHDARGRLVHVREDRVVAWCRGRARGRRPRPTRPGARRRRRRGRARVASRSSRGDAGVDQLDARRPSSSPRSCGQPDRQVEPLGRHRVPVAEVVREHRPATTRRAPVPSRGRSSAGVMRPPSHPLAPGVDLDADCGVGSVAGAARMPE